MISRFFRPLHFILSVFGHALGGIICGLAIIPSYIITSFVWSLVSSMSLSLVGVLLLCISIGVSYFLFGYLFLLLAVIFRFLFRLRSHEGTCPIRTNSIFSFAAYNGLLIMTEHFFLPLVRGTPLIVWFYRGMGAKIGDDCIINTTHIYDCDFIEIGDFCVIGGHVVINAHSGEKGLLIRKRVKIGNHVSIGEYTTILSGTIIEDNVTIGANSLVPKNSYLRANLIFGGVPVRQIGEIQVYRPPESIPSMTKSSDAEDKTVKGIALDIEKIDVSKVLLTSYERRHTEIQSIEVFISQVSVASMGLFATIILYSLLNSLPKLLVMLPLLAGLSFLILLNLNTSMLKLAYNMCNIELQFAAAGVQGFDWESRYGMLGTARMFDIDSAILTLIFGSAFITGIFFTLQGYLVAPNALFLNISMQRVFLYIDAGIASCIVFATIHMLYRRRILIVKLNKIREKNTE